jgi:hypothetical protein
MSVERERRLEPRMQRAIAELEGLIRARYPDATFRVTRHPEAHDSVLLKPVVDVDDRDEVMDVIIDRLGELQAEEHLPILVVPVRPPARREAIRWAMQQAAPARRGPLPPVQP